MAAVGGLVRDGNGSWIFDFTVKIVTTSSFMAKLWGLREGLRLVKEKGLRDIEVEMYTEAVVKVINNGSMNEQEANVLLMDCRTLLDENRFLGLSHTLREGNKCVDHLTNQGRNSKWGMLVLERLPEDLENLLSLDAARVVSRRV